MLSTILSLLNSLAIIVIALTFMCHVQTTQPICASSQAFSGNATPFQRLVTSFLRALYDADSTAALSIGVLHRKTVVTLFDGNRVVTLSSLMADVALPLCQAFIGMYLTGAIVNFEGQDYTVATTQTDSSEGLITVVRLRKYEEDSDAV